MPKTWIGNLFVSFVFVQSFVCSFSFSLFVSFGSCVFISFFVCGVHLGLSHKWTLISIKTTKIALFSLSIERITCKCQCKYRFRFICKSIFWMSLSVNIKCNLFYWQFSACHFTQTLIDCIWECDYNRCQLVLSTEPKNRRFCLPIYIMHRFRAT